MTDIPPWPGPLTVESLWAEVEARLDHHLRERLEAQRLAHGAPEKKEKPSDAGE